MRLLICAVGRLKAGPSKDLFDHYVDLLRPAAPKAGFAGFSLIEIDSRKSPGGGAAQRWQGERLIERVPQGAWIVALDEHGQSLSSQAFASTLGQWRDRGIKDVAFLIGGADGLAPEVLKRADASLALGPATWPHMLARVLLAEQLYRAACILTGHPYHRG